MWTLTVLYPRCVLCPLHRHHSARVALGSNSALNPLSAAAALALSASEVTNCRLIGEGVLQHCWIQPMASPQAPCAGSLEPLGLLWAVDLALSPGSAACVREHLDQQANVLGWMLSFSREVNRVSQEEFGRAGAG